MHLDDMAAVRKQHYAVFGGKIDHLELIFRYQRFDGRWIRLLSQGQVSLRAEDGTPTLMSGIVIDISHLSDGVLALTPLPGPAEGAPLPAGKEEAGPPAETSGLKRFTRRAWMNERRLNALYELSQMEGASEDEVAHFALASIMQLTASQGAFIFFPEADLMGRGRMFWSRGHYLDMGREFLPDDRVPEDFHPRITDESGTPVRRMLRNGDGKTPLSHLHGGKVAIIRDILCTVVEDGRIVCMAGVRNKKTDYDESDAQQVETFLKSTWLILRRYHFFQELRHAKNAAENANRAKDEFLANISHELRTPLNGILSMLQLLEDMPMPQQQLDLVTTANYSGKALVRIISDILDFSRMESGKMQLVPEPFDVKASLVSSLRLFEDEAANRGLRFAFSIDPALPTTLTGDDARVRQVVFNLVGNAMKFTERGGIDVHCALEERLEDGKVRVGIRVADTGIGIPREKQGVIFDAFTQVDSSSTKKYPGTGLGLSIVKRLAALMDGEVKLESEPGKGTTVSCSLVLGMAAESPPKSAKRKISPKPSRLLDILVAEDDAVARFALRSFLQRAGHKVVCVNDGHQALQALRMHPFDCLFTDIQMPDMDGVELTQRIRNNDVSGIAPTDEVCSLVRAVFPEAANPGLPIDPHCFIVAVSAHTMAGDKDKFLRHGINHYIAKPIAMKQLNEVLCLIAAQSPGQTETARL
jgi:signal transduction histidine kinase/CheY-like chemotaxis protein/PAS domain-containing protein